MSEANSLKSVMAHLAEAEKQRAEPGLTSRQRRARTVARLAAVQALYQMELGGQGVDTVVDEFLNHRFDADMDGEHLAEADEAWFAEIVRGVVAGQKAIDTAVVTRLASGWRIERLDATLRACCAPGCGSCARSPRCRARSSSTNMWSWPRRSSTRPRPSS